MPGRHAGCRSEKALTRQQAQIASTFLQGVWCPGDSDVSLDKKSGMVDTINEMFAKEQLEQNYSKRKLDDAMSNRRYTHRKMMATTATEKIVDIVDALPEPPTEEIVDIVNALPTESLPWDLPDEAMQEPIDEMQLDEYNFPHAEELPPDVPQRSGGRVRKRPSRWIEDPRSSANVNGNPGVYVRLTPGT